MTSEGRVDREPLFDRGTTGFTFGNMGPEKGMTILRRFHPRPDEVYDR